MFVLKKDEVSYKVEVLLEVYIFFFYPKDKIFCLMIYTCMSLRKTVSEVTLMELRGGREMQVGVGRQNDSS